MRSDQLYDVVREIAETPEINKKKQILESTPQLRPVLWHTYNPYRRYYIKKMNPAMKGQGNAQFNAVTFRILDDLNLRVLSGKQAKQTLTNHIWGLTPRSANLLRMVIQKDLRCGINIRIINDVWPGFLPEFNILLAEDFEEDRIKYPCYVSPKINGLRAVVSEGKFFTRSGRRYIGLEHFEARMKDTLGDSADGLDGELIVPNMEFNEMSGLLRSHNQVKNILYWLFDIPRFGHLPFSSRLMSLETFRDTLPFIKIIPHTTVDDIIELKAYFEICIDKGLEGIVVKSTDHKYHGRRSFDWMRMKAEPTVELPVIQLLKGTGKYRNQLGAVLCMNNGAKVKVGSGFSDQERKEFWGNPDSILGKIISVTYHEKTPAGSLRHPRFKGIREDLM